jgi:hypothetical protein
MNWYVKSPVKKGVHDSKAQMTELQRMRGLLRRRNSMMEAAEIPRIGVAIPTRPIQMAIPIGWMLVPGGTVHKANRTVKKLFKFPTSGIP